MIALPVNDEVVTPDATDRELAQAGRDVLTAAARQGQPARLTFAPDDKKGEITLSPSVVRVLSRILDELAQGHAVTVLAMDGELTTQEAAELLHVSRPYFVSLLDQGVLAYRKVGNQRRVRLREVLAYKQQQYEQSTRAMRQVTQLSQDMGLYD